MLLLLLVLLLLLLFSLLLLLRLLLFVLLLLLMVLLMSLLLPCILLVSFMLTYFAKESLHWDAKSRMTVEAALQHPYLQELHCPEDEPTPAPLGTADFEFEHQDMSSKELRQDLFREILQYHPEVGDQSNDEESESCLSDSSWQLDTALISRRSGRLLTL